MFKPIIKSILRISLSALLPLTFACTKESSPRTEAPVDERGPAEPGMGPRAADVLHEIDLVGERPAAD